MASGSDRNAALMSIHPEYAAQILEGSKLVEFRRARFATEPTFIVIYATAPVSKVIGFFEVNGVDEASPTELWKRYRDVGGIGSTAYRAYFHGARRGIAIRVGRVHSLNEPIELSALIGDSPPPQSFRYLGMELLNRLVQDASELLPGQQELPIGV